MLSATALRIEIEHALQDRFPAALTPMPRVIRDFAATGVSPIDALLGGGLPIGAISELTGPHSSGRTSLALAFLAQRSADGTIMRLGGFRGCPRSGVGGSKWCEPAALALGAMQKCLSSSPYSDIVKIGCIEMLSRGRASIRHCARRICCCRLADLRPSYLTWVIRNRNMACAFLWRPGSGFGRRPTALDAAWWCWEKSRMRNRVQRWCWSAPPCMRKSPEKLRCAVLRLRRARDESLRRLHPY